MWSWGWVLMVAGSGAGRPGWGGTRPASPEAAGDVVLGLLLRGIGEDRLRGAVLDQIAQVHEGGEVGHARGLLHVVGDDDDGVVALELLDQLFDAAGRDGVERRGRFVQ